MTIIKRFTYAIAAFAAAFSLTCCQEPVPPAGEGVLFANEFVLNGTASSIGSAVRFDQDNNTIQFWLSPSSGLTTADEIENAGVHIVISTHKSFIGSRDRFTKAGSFVRSGDSQFATGDEGMGYIETSIIGDTLILKFAIETLSTKGEEPSEAVLYGEYKGVYSTFTDTALVNEWAVDRDRNSLTSAKFTEREDGGVDTFVLNDANGAAIEFTMPQSRRGLPTLFNTSDTPMAGVTMKYDGNTIDVSEAFGSITAMIDETEVKVSFDITSDSKRIRAEYEGAYEYASIKANRYIYRSGYPSGSGYDGKFGLEGLRISEFNGVLKLEFLPIGTDGRFSDIPELQISDQTLIGKSEIDLRNTPGWHFEFDKIVVDCFENEWKPAPVSGSFLTIIETENGYIVNMELATEEPTFKYISTIDLYYEGPVTERR